MGSASPIGRISYNTDPETISYSVKSAWNRLKKWGAVHLPKALAGLNPPATTEHLRQFETVIGTKLPNDVRESFRVHNGQIDGGLGIVYGLPWLSLADSLCNWKTWVEGYAACCTDGSAPDMDKVCSSFPNEFVRQAYFDPLWIPLTYDSGGNHIGIDLNPGPKGSRGQVIVFGRDDEFHTVLARSWGQFLTDLAQELEQGNFRIDNSTPDYPEFTMDDPYTKHFHSVGISWSRGKLGLSKLTSVDEMLWKKRHGK